MKCMIVHARSASVLIRSVGAFQCHTKLTMVSFASKAMASSTAREVVPKATRLGE